MTAMTITATIILAVSSSNSKRIALNITRFFDF